MESGPIKLYPSSHAMDKTELTVSDVTLIIMLSVGTGNTSHKAEMDMFGCVKLMITAHKLIYTAYKMLSILSYQCHRQCPSPATGRVQYTVCKYHRQCGCNHADTSSQLANCTQSLCR